MIKRMTLGLLFVLLTVPTTEAQAQELARVYFLTPQPATGRAVEAALGDFADWLRQEGDPWNWSFLQIVAGDNLGSWVMRSAGHTWADFDARDAGFGPRAVERFQATVLPLLQSVTLQIEQRDENLTRLPAQGGGNSVFHITDWQLEPAGIGPFNQSVASMIASYDQTGVTYYAGYHNILSGDQQPMKRRVRSYPNWAAFANAPNLGQTLIDAYGQDGTTEILNTYGGAVKTVSDFVLRIRPEMNVDGM